MSRSEKLLHEIEILMKPILIHGRGVNFGPDCKTAQKEIIKEYINSEMLEIENYKGFNIKIIIKQN